MHQVMKSDENRGLTALRALGCLRVSPRPQLLQRVCSLEAPTGSDRNELTKSLLSPVRGPGERQPSGDPTVIPAPQPCPAQGVHRPQAAGPDLSLAPGWPRDPSLAPGWLRDRPGPLQQHSRIGTCLLPMFKTPPPDLPQQESADTAPAPGDQWPDLQAPTCSRVSPASIFYFNDTQFLRV